MAPTGRLSSEEDVKRLFQQMASKVDDEASKAARKLLETAGPRPFKGCKGLDAASKTAL